MWGLIIVNRKHGYYADSVNRMSWCIMGVGGRVPGSRAMTLRRGGGRVGLPSGRFGCDGALIEGSCSPERPAGHAGFGGSRHGDLAQAEV